jgi:hypothetical protein
MLMGMANCANASALTNSANALLDRSLTSEAKRHILDILAIQYADGLLVRRLLPQKPR